MSLTGIVLKMPYRLDPNVIAHIEDALRQPDVVIDELYLKQLALNYDTTLCTIYRHKARVALDAPVERRRGGPRAVILWPIQQAIKLLLDQRPWYY
jgi:hypothetical protein